MRPFLQKRGETDIFFMSPDSRFWASTLQQSTQLDK